MSVKVETFLCPKILAGPDVASCRALLTVAMPPCQMRTNNRVSDSRFRVAERLSAGARWHDEEWVLSTWGWDPNNAGRSFRAAVRRTKVRPQELHALRHSTTSVLLGAGVPSECVPQSIDAALARFTGKRTRRSPPESATATSKLRRSNTLADLRHWGVGLRSYQEPWLDAPSARRCTTSRSPTPDWNGRCLLSASRRGWTGPSGKGGTWGRLVPVTGPRCSECGWRWSLRYGAGGCPSLKRRGGSTWVGLPSFGCSTRRTEKPAREPTVERGTLPGPAKPGITCRACCGDAQCHLGGAKPGFGPKRWQWAPLAGGLLLFRLAAPTQPTGQRASAPSGTKSTKAYTCNRIPPPPDQLRLPPRTRGGEGNTRVRPPRDTVQRKTRRPYQVSEREVGFRALVALLPAGEPALLKRRSS